MSDYIKREDAIRQIVKTSAQNELDIPAIGTVIYILSEMDSADVRENVRGEWLPHPNGQYKEWDVCSACGTGFKRREYDIHANGKKWVTEYNFPFCPNCGAEMRSISALSENVEIASNLKRGES